MDRVSKEELVASLHRLFNETSVLVVTHYSGLNVAKMNELRDKMREAGAGFKVIKNRLTRLAIADTKYQDLSDLFTGPTAIAYSKDPVSAPKVVVNFAKQNDQLSSSFLQSKDSEPIMDNQKLKNHNLEKQNNQHLLS